MIPRNLIATLLSRSMFIYASLWNRRWYSTGDPYNACAIEFPVFSVSLRTGNFMQLQIIYNGTKIRKFYLFNNSISHIVCKERNKEKENQDMKKSFLDASTLIGL